MAVWGQVVGGQAAAASGRAVEQNATVRCHPRPCALHKTSVLPNPLLAPLQPRPKPIGMRYPLAWVTSTVSAPEAAVVKFAGVDALMYL